MSNTVTTSWDTFRLIDPDAFLRHHLEHNVRPDNREKFNNTRELTISCGKLSNADGSAVIRLGDTLVAAGIKAQLSPLKSGQKDEGFLVPNVDFSPMCQPGQFKPGPPTELAQATSLWLEQTLSNVIDPKDLRAVEGHVVWALYLDVVFLNLDGNAQDSCLIAAMAALSNLRLPAVELEEMDMQEDAFGRVFMKSKPLKERLIVDVQRLRSLKLSRCVASCSFVYYDNTKLLVDPTQAEEDMASSKVTIVLTDKDECHVCKEGGQSIKDDQIDQCIKEAKKHCKHLFSAIRAANQSIN